MTQGHHRWLIDEVGDGLGLHGQLTGSAYWWSDFKLQASDFDVLWSQNVLDKATKIPLVLVPGVGV